MPDLTLTPCDRVPEPPRGNVRARCSGAPADFRASAADVARATARPAFVKGGTDHDAAAVSSAPAA